MNILYIGQLYNQQKEEELLRNSKSGLGIASNILQTNILKSIRHKCHSIQVQSYLPVGNYPNLNNKMYYTSDQYRIDKSIPVKEIKTFNLPIIKNIQRYLDTMRYINQWKQSILDDKPKVIIIYDLYLPFLKIIESLKKKHKDITVILIIPDLVGQFRNQQDSNLIINKIMNYLSKFYFSLLKNADGYIVISEQISNFLEEKPYLVINGIVSNEVDLLENTEKDKEKVVFMYAGLLSRQYEIDIMAETFHQFDGDNVELWVCGYGELQELFEENIFNNVRYFGTLPKKEVSKLEEKVTVMINPRPNKGEYTKYSFPSKNLEYLISGKPVVTHKLDSFSKDYTEVFDYITNNTNDLTAKIVKYSTMSKEEINEISKKNRAFALDNFSICVQGKKIRQFISKVVEKI